MSEPPPGAASQREREAFYDRAKEFTPILGASTDGGMFIVRTRDKHIGRSLFVKEARGEMSVLGRAVSTIEALYGEDAVRGKDFIDVGANIGTTIVPALLNHGFDRGLALEPEDENFATLRVNALLNGLDGRIAAFRMAASNREGSAELVVNPEQGGKHWVLSAGRKRPRLRDRQEIVRIETTTLDRLAEDGGFDPDRTGMLWIDAQSHEGHIVEGASCLTSRGVPILLEWDPTGLDKLGDRGKLHAVAERSYTHFAGMRADPAGDGPKFWLRPVVELHAYAERFLDPNSRQRLTDLLLLRLEAGALPAEPEGGEVDLSKILARHTREQAQKTPAPEGGRRSLRRAWRP